LFLIQGEWGSHPAGIPGQRQEVPPLNSVILLWNVRLIATVLVLVSASGCITSGD
jgi:hypothetical protein